MRVKKTFLLVLVLVLAGCVGTNELLYIPPEQEVIALDFGPYVERGFMFTVDEVYRGSYEPRGLISVTLFPEAVRDEVTAKNALAPRRIEQIGQEQPGRKQLSDWRVTPITSEQMLEAAYRAAIGLGADALIQFDIDEVKEWIGSFYGVDASAYRVTGFAIKRLDQ